MKSKFLLYLMIVVLIIFALANIIMITFANSFIDRVEKTYLIQWGLDFESMLEPFFIHFDYLNMVSKVEEIQKKKEKNFIILYNSKKNEILNKTKNFKIDFKIKLKSETNLEKIKIHDSNYYILTIPVKTQYSDIIWGYILYGHSLLGEKPLISGIKRHFFYLSIILLIFILVIFRIIIKKVTNPLETIKEGLEMVSHGNLSYRIKIDSKDEFSFLADKFNEMGEKLEKTMTEIESTHKNLEDQISDRTKALNQTNKKLQKAMEELKNTQKKIIQSEKQKSLSAIVSGFAHEINNPLTGILGYIDLMELREDISPYIKEKLTHVKIQAHRIKDIINELNLLNPDANQTKLEINLGNLLDKLMKIIGNKRENKNITFEKKFINKNLIIYGNHFSLWQVFEGIIENSIESINDRNIKEGKIEIILKKSFDDLQGIIEINDNGGGFENIEKAFDPFYTTKSRTKKKGIGLSISYNIIQDHKGNILISNKKKGASIMVYLPLYKKTKKIAHS